MSLSLISFEDPSSEYVCMTISSRPTHLRFCVFDHCLVMSQTSTCARPLKHKRPTLRIPTWILWRWPAPSSATGACNTLIVYKDRREFSNFGLDHPPRPQAHDHAAFSNVSLALLDVNPSKPSEEHDDQEALPNPKVFASRPHVWRRRSSTSTHDNPSPI
ncbi:hypothetical protein OF83DRAFT_1175738 [Amylostereum chailletii]|nr:hypothetical protein OF83DRAFT_1175738 [Amylostereum chailletii]